MSRDLSLQRLALRLLVWLSIALFVLFGAQLAFDLWLSGQSFRDLRLLPEQGLGLASSVSRAFNNLLAMVLAFIAVAVPLTANIYTPRLVEIFMTDRLNLLALSFYALLAANAIFVHGLPHAGQAQIAQYVVVWMGGMVGFLVLVPYYFYVLGFLDPDAIIAKIGSRIAREYAVLGQRRLDVPDAQQRVHTRIQNLGNVTLRAVERGDRDVVLTSIRAMRRAIAQYAEVKPRCKDAWFAVPSELFVGMADEAVAMASRERAWVEHRCLSQLLLAYNAALGRMPDAVSLVSQVTRETAVSAANQHDLPLVDVCVRFLNTYLRAAIGKRDVHAIHDVFHQYGLLACDLLLPLPEFSLRVARHLRYYADFARHERVPFVYELAAYELAAVVEAAYVAQAPVRGELLTRFLGFDADGTSVRLTTAKAVLAGFFAQSNRQAELELVRQALSRASLSHLRIARRNLTETTDPVFWEITPRQRNLDYVEPSRRQAIAAVLDEVMARQSEGRTPA